jgi:hypothetical protein
VETRRQQQQAMPRLVFNLGSLSFFGPLGVHEISTLSIFGFVVFAI